MEEKNCREKNNLFLIFVISFMTFVFACNVSAAVVPESMSSSSNSDYNYNYPASGSSYGSSNYGNTYSYSQVQSYQPSYNRYYTQEQISTYWPILGQNGMCGQNSPDFLVQVSPLLGCSPYVVRSDLLAEQNVPVFCQLDSLQINPLINVAAIDHISFSGREYPAGVSGIGFHPARVALYSQQRGSLNNPLVNNIGYVVVVLKRTPNESAMPDFVEGNLTATLRYDIQKAFGIGQVSQMLPVLSDEQWESSYKQYGFWQGRAYARAEEVGIGEAQIGIYSPYDKKIATVNLNMQNRKSGIIYIPGMYCRAGLTAELVETSYPKPSVVIRADSDSYTLGVGQSFYNGRCRVTSITPDNIGGASVGISCPQSPFNLILGSKSIRLAVDSVNGDYKIGSLLKTETDGRKIYLAGIEYRNDENGKIISYAILMKTSLGQSDLALKNVLSAAADYSSKNQAVPLTDSKSYADGLASQLNTNYKIPVTAAVTKDPKNPDYEIKVLKEDVTDANQNFGVGFPAKTLENSDIVCDKDSVLPTSGNDGAGAMSACTSFQTYFDETRKSYYQLGEEFTSEKMSDGTFYGDSGFNSLQSFAGTNGMHASQKQIVEKWNQIYPESIGAKDAMAKINANGNLDYSAASRVTLIDGKSIIISLDRVIMPSTDDVNVVADVIIPALAGSGATTTKFNQNLKLRLNSDVLLDNENSADTIRLEELHDNYVIANVYCSQTQSTTTTNYGGTVPGSHKMTLTMGQSVGVCSGKYNINVKTIEYKRVAVVNIYPNVQGATSTVNFSFHIGIEKRAIEITPEVAMDRIKALNETIKEWEEISDNLRSVLKVWKGACIGVAGAMIVKNFFTNLDGGATARKLVMAQWKKFCEGKIGNGPDQSSTLTACYEKYSNEIESDFNLQKQIIKEQNDDLSKNNADGNADGFFNSADDNILGKNYYTQQGLGAQLSNPESVWAADDAVAKGKYTKAYIDSNIAPNGARTLSIYDARTIENDLKMIKGGNEAMKVGARNELKNTLNRIEENNKFKESVGSTNLMTPQSLPGARPTTTMMYHGYTWKDYEGLYLRSPTDSDGNDPGNLANNPPVEYVRSGSKNYLVALNSGPNSNSYNIQSIYSVGADGQQLSYLNPKEDSNKNIYESLGAVSFTKAGNYKTRIKEPEVIYYTASPYDGLPVQVPFDVANGWYAVVQPNVLGFGGQGTQDASGSINNFWVCNAGEDGIMNGVGSQDLCAIYRVGTDPVSAFNGLDLYKTKSLVSAAYRALRDAAGQYKKDVKEVTINGVKMKVKNKSTTASATECADIMPVEDCKKIFNVCDPVICPSSRCNLGGRMYVDDVVASGIAGSIALCLPNFVAFGGDVIVPVCLTGIQAGIDNFISILKSTRDCLQERITTGQYVGICDEMTSIYMCQFFWNNAAPLVKGGFSGLLGMISGENNKGKGGGEYLTVSDAWTNAQSSVEYLTQSYGANSYKAFNIRSTEDAGFKFCKTFIGVNVPEAIDKAIEPDSPTQFYATVEETPFTTATVPATSQYKVFYQIYAGKDQGVFYQIYLRNSLQQTSAYGVVGGVTAGEQFVSQGYIAKGGQASQAKDFTFPKGYTELCIVINQKENCGFKTVTSSYGLNYLKDKYAQEQASKEITSAKDCVSGTPSLYSMAQPNVQAGVQSTINPQLYANTGIVRVCATAQPGKATDASRWEEVGYCDTTSVKCWMDKNSVATAIQDRALRAETLGEAQQIVDGSLNGNILAGSVAADEIKKFETHYSQPSVLSTFVNPTEGVNVKFDEDYNNLYNRLFLTNDKAKLLSVKAGIYSDVAKSYRQKFTVKDVVAAQTANVQTPTTGGTSGTTSGGGICSAITDPNLCPFKSSNNFCYWSNGKCINCPSSSVDSDSTLNSIKTSAECNNLCGSCYDNKCFWNTVNKKCEITSAWQLIKVKLAANTMDINAIKIDPNKNNIYFKIDDKWYSGTFSSNIIDVPNRNSINDVSMKQKLDSFVDSNSAVSSTGRSVATCTDKESCQKVLGKKILEIVKSNKNSFSYLKDITDENVDVATGYKNLGCLMVGIAMYETSDSGIGLTHCKKSQENSNPLYCDGYPEETFNTSNSYGIMQINTAEKDSDGKGISYTYSVLNLKTTNKVQMSVFENNVEMGLYIFDDKYNIAKTSNSNQVFDYALNLYNGGAGYYSIAVKNQKSEVEKLFPTECA